MMNLVPTKDEPYMLSAIYEELLTTTGLMSLLSSSTNISVLTRIVIDIVMIKHYIFTKTGEKCQKGIQTVESKTN